MAEHTHGYPRHHFAAGGHRERASDVKTLARGLAGKRVLLVGATGFIGAAVAARLIEAGAEVAGVSRSAPHDPRLRHVQLDVGDATEPARWLPLLQGIDAVVYCAGVIQRDATQSPRAVHELGPTALFRACALAGVLRVVHVSALGAERATTEFSATKLAGDRVLMGSGLDWVILRPSVVIGREAFGGAAMLRGLAALPLLPLPENEALLRVVDLDDVVATVLFFLDETAPARVVVELAGPREWRLAELIAAFRRWLGSRPAPIVRLPRVLWSLGLAFGDAMGALGWQSALRGNAGRELLAARPGSPRHWTELTGIAPADILHTLLSRPASTQERWFARLYLLRLPLFALCALFWISTGVIALGPGWTYGIRLMNEGGIFGWQAAAVVIGGALCDIAVGLAIGWRRTAPAGIVAAFIVTAVYGVIGTVLVPRLWSDPLGPMLKIFPILALHLAALGIVEERR